MNIFYRISNNSYNKQRLPISKEKCLDNFLSVFKDCNINLIADNVTDETLLSFIKSKQFSNFPFNVEYTSLNNALSFRHCLQRAAAELPLNQAVYFVEDDYLHLPNAKQIILEGLSVADYCSGYDHPDKYLNANQGGNPKVEDGGEITRVIITKSTHWKLTNSTTCTFATSTNALQADLPVWEKYTAGSYPDDYLAFSELIKNGRSLITPIPSVSTHIESKWLAPLIDWNKYE